MIPAHVQDSDGLLCLDWTVPASDTVKGVIATLVHVDIDLFAYSEGFDLDSSTPLWGAKHHCAVFINVHTAVVVNPLCESISGDLEVLVRPEPRRQLFT